MKILLFHPGGSAIFAHHTARAYYEAGILDRYYVTFAYRPERVLGKVLTGILRILTADPGKELRRRQVIGIPDELIVTHPFWEIVRTVSSKVAGPIITDRIWEISEHDFGRFVARRLKQGITAVHGYEHGSLEVFKKAKTEGIRTVYEMPAPFHRTTTAILEREYARFPDAITAYKKGTDRLTPLRNARREEELALADVVVCNSRFTERSLIEAGVSPKKIVRVPYGAPEAAKIGNEVTARDGRIVILYAGTLSIRKGAHYLLGAWRKLSSYDNIELRIFGAVNMPEKLLADLPGKVSVRPTIAKSDLFKQYQEADLLAFPTLCDGFGMVLTEALANGCPVLTTPNAGSADYIQDGKNGFIVPAGDADSIRQVLERCITDPNSLRAMRKYCTEVPVKWGWAEYRKELATQVMLHLKNTL